MPRNLFKLPKFSVPKISIPKINLPKISEETRDCPHEERLKRRNSMEEEKSTYIAEFEFEIKESSEFMVRKIFEIALFNAKKQMNSELMTSIRLRRVYKISGPANKENAKEEIS